MRERGWWYRMSLVGVVACAGAVSGCTPGDGAAAPAEAAVSDALEATPELGVLVPAELPAGWSFDSIGGSSHERRRDYYELIFRSTDMSSDPVRLCVELAAAPESLCGADAADPAYVREVGDLRGVWLFPVGDSVGPTVWPAVELTGDWRSAGWISAG
jgi:hypothetical protein